MEDGSVVYNVHVFDDALSALPKLIIGAIDRAGAHEMASTLNQNSAWFEFTE
jgi:hypothetical protein